MKTVALMLQCCVRRGGRRRRLSVVCDVMYYETVRPRTKVTIDSL